MKRLIPLLWLLYFFLPSLTFAADFDYAHYEGLLKRYVKSGGQIDGVSLTTVDYAALFKEAPNPDSDYRLLLKQLAAFNPESLKSREEQMAFWVNAYNIAAIKTIIDHYPVDSITAGKISVLGLPWFRKAVNIGGREYSLWQIENDILLDGFKDLRIHFGINCASVSCPDLLPQPYRAATLFMQLETQGKKLLADYHKGLLISKAEKVVYISQIFKFDHKHFEALGGGALNFILAYLPEAQREELKKGGYKIEYLDYNWKANDHKASGKGL